MRPFLSFYGGKFRSAPHYPAPQYDTIIEPFAGSAGYAVRYYDRKVILVEKDPIIASVWRFLIGSSEADILRLPLLEAGQSTDDLAICQEARWFIGFWLNSGTERPRKTKSSWRATATGLSAGWGVERRAQLAAQVPLISHWKIIPYTYAAAPPTEATWFIDPPYVNAGKHYNCASSDIDYSYLSIWCRSRPGQVIVCENAGAKWLPFQPFRSIHGTEGKRRSGVSHEVIYTQTTTLSEAKIAA